MHGIKTSAINAALVNCILARSYDFEPVSPMVGDKFWPGHISGTTIPTAITLGEAKNLNGRELITAILVGDDVASRLIASSGFDFGPGWTISGRLTLSGPLRLPAEYWDWTSAR